MKDIQKGKEPASLTEHRQAGGTFDGPGPWKTDLKRALLKEQGALCCYCMGRIEFGSMKVEHRLPQHEHAPRQLEYRNLLGACPGSQDNPRHEGQDLRHCDTRKGGRALGLDPVAGVERWIRYGFAEGRIFSDDPGVARELDELLNLNAQNLRGARAAVVRGLIEHLGRRYGDRKTWSKGALQRELDRWSSRDGDVFRPFCQVAVEFLRDRLRRAS